jgi:hypothetical protein
MTGGEGYGLAASASGAGDGGAVELTGGAALDGVGGSVAISGGQSLINTVVL